MLVLEMSPSEFLVVVDEGDDLLGLGQLGEAERFGFVLADPAEDGEYLE